jgi:hypothetical protein
VAVVAAGGLAVAAAAPEAAIAKSVRFTDKITGIGISATQSVFQAQDSYFGSGAGTQVIKLNASGTGATDKETSYFGNAVLFSKGSAKLGAPNSAGIAPLTGSGHDYAGTGRAKHVTSTYRYTGTYNTRTGLYTVTLKGTYHF